VKAAGHIALCIEVVETLGRLLGRLARPSGEQERLSEHEQSPGARLVEVGRLCKLDGAAGVLPRLLVPITLSKQASIEPLPARRS